jgi:hypothetical protein
LGDVAEVGDFEGVVEMVEGWDVDCLGDVATAWDVVSGR